MATCNKPLRLVVGSEGWKSNLGISRPVACGKCLACRINHARDWALRIMHEARFHDANSFLTLSYSDAALPWDLGLSKREFQLFMKRLRKHLEPHTIRFFGCGEYGEDKQRPHYHLIVFGHDFSGDRKLQNMSKGRPLYRSDTLDRLWGFGHAWIGDVTLGSAQYVARYNLKKAVSYNRGENYRRVEPETGRTWDVEPEFLLMSRRPGIGSAWYDKFASDAFPSEFLVFNNKRLPVPRFYRQKYEKELAELGHVQMRHPLQKNALRKRASSFRNPAERSTDRQLTRDEVLHRGAPSTREPE